MQPTLALNAIFGSVLIIILVFADYVRKFNTDRFQRNIFCGLLIFSFIPMMGDMAYLPLSDLAGGACRPPLRVLGAIIDFFQILAYYYVVVFVDYMACRNTERAKKVRRVVCAAAVAHTIMVLLCPAEKYHIRLIAICCPALAAAWDLLRSPGMFKISHLAVAAVFLGFSFFGSFMDLTFGSVKLVWPCVTAALLYAYFFIVRSDARIDSLTGIGNRFSFNEFIDRIARLNNGETWAFVMIDMDRFKEINDTLGHREGDIALCDMAAIIRKCVDTSGFAARYGGDEFVLATRKETGVAPLMRRIQDAMDQYNAKQDRPFKLEISYGYDVYTADGSRSLEEFLAHIDSLMYKCKQERRRAGDKKSGAKT
jgi:diguanylate cyclase (GGDEF)-like protein